MQPGAEETNGSSPVSPRTSAPPSRSGSIKEKEAPVEEKKTPLKRRPIQKAEERPDSFLNVQLKPLTKEEKERREKERLAKAELKVRLREPIAHQQLLLIAVRRD